MIQFQTLRTKQPNCQGVLNKTAWSTSLFCGLRFWSLLSLKLFSVYSVQQWPQFKLKQIWSLWAWGCHELLTSSSMFVKLCMVQAKSCDWTIWDLIIHEKLKIDTSTTPIYILSFKNLKCFLWQDWYTFVFIINGNCYNCNLTNKCFIK